MSTITDEELFSHAEGLKGKVVLITGGGNGIGQAAAIRFAQYGAKVIIGDLDVAGGKHTVRECLRAGGTIGADAMVKDCNVTLWEDQVALFAAGYEKYGRIDYVVCNAGIASKEPFALSGVQRGAPVKPSTAVVDVNLIGTLFTTRLAQHYLMKNKISDQKAIILIGSMSSHTGLPKGEIYCATKHAVLGLADSLNDEMKLWGIRMAIICPWFTDTAILPTATKVILAGLPMTSLERVAGAIVNAATDTDWATNGSSYTIPDDGTVFRVPRSEINVGAYKILNDRVMAVMKTQHTLTQWFNTASDLFILAAPYLTAVAFLIPIVAYYYITKFLSK